MTYTFSATDLLTVTDHANALDITIESLSLMAGVYIMTTAQPFPPEQLAHLGMTEVA